MATQESSHNEGSFFTGFSVGLVAGAVGYFLFATQKGEKVWQSLQDEWDAAKKSMVKSGVEEVGESLRDFVAKSVHSISERVRSNSSSKESSKTDTSDKSKQTAKKISATKKFKGV